MRAEAVELIFQSRINGWLLQVMTTKVRGYWIFQLTNDADEPLALLIDLDRLGPICGGLSACIDAALNPDRYPRVKTMHQIVGSKIPTPRNDAGAISVTSDWTDVPFLTITYCRGECLNGSKSISQSLLLDDAMAFYNYIGKIYNDFENKDEWRPQP